METLAYLHLALSEEELADTPAVLTESNQTFFQWLKEYKLVTHHRIYLLLLVATLSIVGMAEEALAQRVLREGRRGADVTEVQRRLRELGYFNRQPTGYFGSITKNAVIRFQRDKGLPADGEVGPRTRATLFPSQTRVAPSRRNLNQSGLRRGSRGSAVTEVQRQLRELRYFNADPTGYFGPVTEQAVIRFQTDYGLRADGIVGSQTRAELSNALVTQSQPFRFLPGEMPLPPADFSSQEPIAFGTPIRSSELRPGDRGPEVKRLQQALRSRGFNPGPVDGRYGEQTEDAVFKFQIRNNNLLPTGIADLQTLQALGFIDINPETEKNRYVVVIPIHNDKVLNQIKLSSGIISDDDIISEDNRGRYFNAGAFSSRSEAESLSYELRSQGFDARVAYF
ncbi:MULTISPECIES: peptidoglycan-binding protein [unclassified Moorena]|uniref:peptidoglycan-binding domain-containing protein n=1 Tax=unclassified Moorena TaxID=2683338 RepID=UPI0013C7F925|nr:MULTISPECIES: peptidoglycan-binding protein [unclassified Moorena]NEO20721.1 peptidoglycan-binding protein [Moorena sp. SIO4A5]NEP25473.1 peptidoglycan-binding protein [Moorena sp. SIO3I6]NEQ61395.1 peptidoglycan-binding protein [Moorena sp. SIO4A1]